MFLLVLLQYFKNMMEISSNLYGHNNSQEKWKEKIFHHFTSFCINEYAPNFSDANKKLGLYTKLYLLCKI